MISFSRILTIWLYYHTNITTEAFLPSSLTTTAVHRSRSITPLSSSTLDKNEIAVDDLKKLTVVQLKEKLKLKGLPVSGTKQKLIDRLLLENEESITSVMDEMEEEYEEVVDDDIETVVDENKRRRKKDSSSLSATEKYFTKKLKKKIDGENQDNKNNNDFPIPLPEPLLQCFVKEQMGDDPNESTAVPTTPELLPVQRRAFEPISSGKDVVLFAPTGSGKTLGYVLPLYTQLLRWKKTKGALKKRKRYNQGDYYSRNEPTSPAILVLAPSRELAQQIGKVWTKYHPTSDRRVATVFGGVPLERHISILRREIDVVVGTPGRIRELLREGYLDSRYVKSIVLDEADVLLNFDDQPEIEMLLNNMEEDYQLTLASATIGRRVKTFVEDVMEMDETSKNFINIYKENEENDDAGTSRVNRSNRPKVNHWYTSANAGARTGLASDIITSLSPRVGIIFVPSKIEVEKVAEELSNKLWTTARVSVLHGDMSQAARTRTVASLRNMAKDTTNNGDNNRCKILVATDVASRGLDLPGVDLVLQFGVPRKNGKDGTYDPDLYIHRSGRAGRVGGDASKDANAIVLYDPNQGEHKILPDMVIELRLSGINIRQRPLPSPSNIMEASYKRSIQACTDMITNDPDEQIIEYFKEKIISSEKELSKEELYHKYAIALASLSGLREKVQERSLLTANEKDRTIRVIKVIESNNNPLTPPEVTKFVKHLGSGKLGRITICKDGKSAVFDLPTKRAQRLLTAYEDSPPKAKDIMHIEIPTSIEF